MLGRTEEKFRLYKKEKRYKVCIYNIQKVRLWINQKFDILFKYLIRYEHKVSQTYIILKWMLWIYLLILFYKFELTAAFLLLSFIYGIYATTGNSSKDTLSAYSVFNPGCISIQGTLKAEQFEKELGYKVSYL